MQDGMDGGTILQGRQHRKKGRFQEKENDFFFSHTEFEVCMGHSRGKTMGIICVSILIIC